MLVSDYRNVTYETHPLIVKIVSNMKSRKHEVSLKILRLKPKGFPFDLHTGLHYLVFYWFLNFLSF